MFFRTLHGSQRRRKHSRAPFLEALETRSMLAAFTTPEDTPLVVTDAAIRFTAAETAPAHGKVTPLAAGGFSYAPDANYFGEDKFTYRASGESATAEPATISLVITPVNDPPVAQADSFGVGMNGALEILSAKILANDTDVDSNALTVMLVAGSGPKNGTLATTPSGNFVYKPNPQFVGSDSFSYFAWDGQAFSATSATVSIRVEPVNQAPVARNDQYTVLQDTTLTIGPPGVLANDGFANTVNPGLTNPGLTAALVEQPKHGSLTFSASGGFVYVPASGFTGAVSFTYRAALPASSSDPTLLNPIASNIATVSIFVAGKNTPPEARNDIYTVARDATLNIGPPGVLANDGVPNGPPLTAAVVEKPKTGTLTLQASGGFVYVPAAGFLGVESFTYRAAVPASATEPAGANPIVSNVATVTIAVVGANTPPVLAVGDQYSANQGQPLTMNAPGVLANDKGGTQERPLFAYPGAGPKGGTLTLKTDGSFVYTPAETFSGLDSFTYRASTTPPDSAAPILEGSVATVSIYVRPKSVAPETRNDHYFALQGATLTIAAPGVLANDGLATNLSLTAELVNGPANGTLTLNSNGSLTYVPAAEFSGQDSFTYRAKSVAAAADPSVPGAGNVATVTISVEKRNPLHNYEKPADVNGDAQVSPIDAVLVINFVLASEPAVKAEGEAGPNHFLDVSGDGYVSPIDALLVINSLLVNETAEGESAGSVAAASDSSGEALDQTVDLLALECAEEAAKRRRS